MIARAILLKKFKYDQAVQKAAQLAGEEFRQSRPGNTSGETSLSPE
jgi:hypothetical protein